MTEPALPDVPAQRGRRAQRAPKATVRPRVSVVGVLGELLITGGVLVLLFLAWQLWWNDAVMAAAQSRAAESIAQGWTEGVPPDLEPAPATEEGYGDPIVAEAPGNAGAFAVLYVPRFGADYHRTIAQGTGTDVLNSAALGIGHYPSTQMPGEVGNFAIASHRSANGGGMHAINELQLNDAIYVQTADGYYTYRFRDFEYVPPSTIEAIAPVPHDPEATAVDRLITLTTCNPLLSTAERIIAYGVFETWQPTSAGPPAELAAMMPAA
ncbi:class E sortase [Cryobacterium sp.]|jgi:sortase A|uniref:class E sortase n=1 Tax=Cryobacterium sp. TaxID=1926290 RepID=UPI002632FCCE|nr:class E sortase [Cryobacterium sp.]MCU1447483.1 sortase [Cryobacterium sp.]